MNQSNNLLNPSDSVFQITESLKKNFRIKSKLVRSNTIQEPKIKPNLTLPNIAKNSKTPKTNKEKQQDHNNRKYNTAPQT